VPFVATADKKSFRKAARELRVTTSAVSKAIARLEAKVGVRLLHRSAHAVSLTSEGEAFLLACRDAVRKVESARELLSAEQAAPRGILRVSLPSTFGRRVVEALPGLLAKHPSLVVEAYLTDRFVQLGDEKIDVAVRIGAVEDSSCVRFPLRTLRLVTAAAPSYLATHGVPRVPADLATHNCLKFMLPSGLTRAWFFRDGDRTVQPDVDGNFRGDHGEPLLAAALAGLGLVQAPDILLATELARRDLVEVLADHCVAGPPLTALVAPGRQRSPKVRALIEMLRALCKMDEGLEGAPGPRASTTLSRSDSRASRQRRTR
ncbi:MAG TPA: LysR family transcriptional regulator, partial [Polyangiaceae bacterium]